MEEGIIYLFIAKGVIYVYLQKGNKWTANQI